MKSKEELITEFVLRPENFEMAWDINEYFENIKNEATKSFWHDFKTKAIKEIPSIVSFKEDTKRPIYNISVKLTSSYFDLYFQAFYNYDTNFGFDLKKLSNPKIKKVIKHFEDNNWEREDEYLYTFCAKHRDLKTVDGFQTILKNSSNRNEVISDLVIELKDFIKEIEEVLNNTVLS